MDNLFLPREVGSIETGDVIPIYYSINNVPYPWHVSNWEVLNNFYLPVPNVTKVL